ncbi:DNA-binding response regulator [Patiriisocius marinistellae]|uniref:DNA-binding response regulator n=1 Tax=Patiriisocius marinistellae TaxID=2494560 RepID=A0A5J4FZX6_9FLAO|nr:response regulator transcription factor [Patiriisocius marinistellae]GEQ86774.1 DNA-binding response regulator [Patiriisocius marinistellae]
MNAIKCIIIDDEELARKLIDTYVDKINYLQCEGTFENPVEALSYIKKNTVDLIFLDIQMPDLKGTDFADLISKSNTRIIFTTAYSEYALQGFELNALDYLVKPITFKRFLSAVEKFPKSAKLLDDTITIKSGYDLHKVITKTIIFIKSDSEYVHYHIEDGKKIMANQSLSKLEASLPNYFLRVHRSYIINKNKITGLKGRDLLLSDQIISVSDSYIDKVKKLFI